MAHQQRVGGVDKSFSVDTFQETVQGQFGFRNRGEVAETFQMGFAYVGDDAEGGQRDAAQLGYLAGMAGPHFNDGYFGIGRH